MCDNYSAFNDLGGWDDHVMMTRVQLEMLKDLHLASKQGIDGIAIRKGDKRALVPLENEGLVYFLSGFGRGDSYSVRLTDKGKNWTAFNFAYAYQDSPRRNQTTYQDQHGKVTLVIN